MSEGNTGRGGLPAPHPSALQVSAYSPLVNRPEALSSAHRRRLSSGLAQRSLDFGAKAPKLGALSSQLEGNGKDGNKGILPKFLFPFWPLRTKLRGLRA